MPEIEGPELCEMILSTDALFGARPVVVGLTADTSEHTHAQCYNSGMKDVVHKPITLDEMRLYFETVVLRLVSENRSERQKQ